MPNTILTLSRRALIAAAVALAAGAAACGESPTAPRARPSASAAHAGKAMPVKADAADRGRRGGYNVVAD